MDREDVLRKIRAMLELSQRGGTEEEMAAAAEMAAAWMLKFNVEHLDLEDHGHTVSETRVQGKYRENWRIDCFIAAANMHMCRHLYFSVGGRDVGIVHCIIGEEHNRIVAVEIARYFESSINRLANDAARQNRDLATEHTQRHRFIRSFRLAASRRLRTRVDAYVAETRRGHARDPDTGSNLPATETLYQQQDRLYAAWRAIHAPNVKTATARDQLLSEYGRLQGDRAGGTISLNRQVRTPAGPAIEDKR